MNKKAFTLIELLVVIAVIALLMAILVPALGRAKMYAQKVICRSNIKQQCLGVLLYAGDNAGRVPNIGTGFWLWDLSFQSTNLISEYAGFTENDVFFCPANKTKQPGDARFWQFSWLTQHPADFGSPNVNIPVPLKDESVLPVNGNPSIQSEYRVMPVLYMFDRVDNTGRSLLPDMLLAGKKSQWIRKTTNINNTGRTIMIMDNVTSEAAPEEWNFFEIDAGDIYSNFGVYDSSNHKSNKRIGQGIEPDGANIGYVDGHVDWRNFDVMQHQITTFEAWFWW